MEGHLANQKTAGGDDRMIERKEWCQRRRYGRAFEEYLNVMRGTERAA